MNTMNRELRSLSGAELDEICKMAMMAESLTDSGVAYTLIQQWGYAQHALKRALALYQDCHKLTVGPGPEVETIWLTRVAHTKVLLDRLDARYRAAMLTR
jgi:hypothetical protein